MFDFHSLGGGELSPEVALSWFQKEKFQTVPPYFMTHWKTGKKFFYARGSMLAYEETGRHLVVAGESLAVEGGSADTRVYLDFDEFAGKKNKKICGYYVDDNWKEEHYFKISLGTSFRVLLNDFNLEAPKSREVRRALRKGELENYAVSPIGKEDLLINIKMQELFRRWKKSKLPIQMGFFLSEPFQSSLIDDWEEWFVVKKNDDPVAFCSLLPYFKDGKKCFYIDALVHNPKTDSHALSFLLSFLIEKFKEEGVLELDFGLSPFAEVDKNMLMGKFFGVLYRNSFLYNPKGLHHFKKKFSGVEEVQYCFFQTNQMKWMGLWDMAMLTLGKRG